MIDFRRQALLACVTVAACADSTGSGFADAGRAEGGDAEAALADASQPGTSVEGRLGFRLVNIAGEAFAARDTAGWTIVATPTDAPDEHYVGEIFSDGRYRITGVPHGERVVTFETMANKYIAVVGTSTRIDIVSTVLGKRGPLPSPNTYLEVTAAGLGPWNAESTLEVFSGSTGPVWFDAQEYAPRDVVVGATRVSAMRLGWAGAAALLAGAVGDDVFVARYGPLSGAGASAFVMSELGGVSRVAMANGGTTSVTATLSAAPAEVALDIVFDDTRAPDSRLAHPDVSDATSYWAFGMLPAASMYGFYDDSPDLAFGFAPILGRLHVVDRIPAPLPGWDGQVTLFREYAVPVQAAGAIRPQNVYCALSVDAPLADFTRASEFGFSLTLPRALVISGRDALSADLSDVGTTPYVEWAPPDRGSPSGYELIVREVVASALGDTELVEVGRVYTAGLAFGVPPRWLEPKHQYLVVLTAVAGFDVTRVPLESGVRESRARMVSRVFSP